MPINTSHHVQVPLYRVLTEIIAVWATANIGFYLILPKFGVTLSYNTSPVAIAIYYLVWAFIAIVYFWTAYSDWLIVDSTIWIYGLLSLGFAGLLLFLIYVFSLLPVPHGLLAAEHTDQLFATPWYFLPKSIEILVQQLLITVLVLELYFRYHKLNSVIIGYAVCFGGAHILLFLLNGSPLPFATTMTLGAFFSALIFPYLMLKVRGGFVYAYMIHFAFYLFLAMFLQLFPVPGFVV